MHFNMTMLEVTFLYEKSTIMWNYFLKLKQINKKVFVLLDTKGMKYNVFIASFFLLSFLPIFQVVKAEAVIAITPKKVTKPGNFST